MIFHDSKGRPCVQYVTRLSCSGGTSRSPKGGRVGCHWRMTMSLWVFKVGKGKDNKIHGFPYSFDYCLYHMMISISMIYIICLYMYIYIQRHTCVTLLYIHIIHICMRIHEGHVMSCHFSKSFLHEIRAHYFGCSFLLQHAVWKTRFTVKPNISDVCKDSTVQSSVFRFVAVSLMGEWIVNARK